MSKHYVWIIPERQQNSFRKQGVSLHYIIPNRAANGYSALLVKANIWLVIRGKGDAVFAYLKPQKAERFLDGINKGDYLIRVDLRNSFKIINLDGSPSEYFFEDLREFQFGINKISPELNKKLLTYVLSKIQTKLQSPQRLVADINLDGDFKNRNLLAKTASQMILQRFCLQDVWGSRMGLALTPFANFTHALVSEHVDGNLANELLPKFQSLDPITRIRAENDEHVEEKYFKQTNVQAVDTDFVEIDVETIYAREFIGSKNELIDMEAALVKTEIAERLHQEMLRDISSFLHSKKITPYESDSIDLMFEFRSKTMVMEIKSTNDVNLIAQCSKGAFQLAYYVDAMAKDFTNLTPILVIHKTNNQEQESLCLKVLSSLNTMCLVYDPSKKWPERLQGLLEN